MTTTRLGLFTCWFALSIFTSACRNDGDGDNNNSNNNNDSNPTVLTGEANCSDWDDRPAETQPWLCCADNVDNDGDGVIDGDDQDCRDYIVEEPPVGLANEVGHCNDGVDNDLDELVDCDDQDCYEDEACYGETDVEVGDTGQEEDDGSDDNEDEDGDGHTNYYLSFDFEGCDDDSFAYLAVITEIGGTYPEEGSYEIIEGCNNDGRIGLNDYEGVTHVWIYSMGFSVVTDDGSEFRTWSNGVEADGDYDSWPSSTSGSVVDDRFAATPSSHTWFNLEVEAD